MDFRRVESLSDRHKDELLVLFEDLWWAKGRGRDDVEVMLAHSLVFALEDEEGRLGAFARAVTDYVYKLWLLDVVVAPRHRGAGLGDRLVEAVLADPALAAVRHIELTCAPDLVPFYRRWGFSAELGTLTMMRLDRAGTGAIPD